MKTLKQVMAVLFVLPVFVSVVSAQVDCPEIVAEALAAAGDACADTGRNQACYGNVDLTAEFRADAPDVEFSETGDITDLTNIEGLTLSNLNEDEGIWGVAVLQVQANLPDTLPGQNVTMLLFGDVEISDAATEDDVQADDFAPMQAFYFRSGVGEAPCAEAPDSGILIQTPEGAGTIELTMNDVNITLGSTAYIQADAGGEMAFNVIEGEGTVEADSVERTVPEGMFVTVPLDEDLRADGEPSEPEPYDAEEWGPLPLVLLPREIEVAEAGSEEGGGAGSDITLQPGTWTQTFASMEGCGVDSSMIANMPATEFDIESSDIESVFAAAGGTGTMSMEGLDMTVTNPELNVYVIEFSAEGTAIRTTYTIVSPTLIEVTSEIVSPDCTITSTATMEYTGG